MRGLCSRSSDKPRKETSEARDFKRFLRSGGFQLSTRILASLLTKGDSRYTSAKARDRYLGTGCSPFSREADRSPAAVFIDSNNVVNPSGNYG